MPYEKVKVYSDGNHYIGIPHTTRPARKSVPKIEGEELDVEEHSSLEGAELVEGAELPFEETPKETTNDSANYKAESGDVDESCVRDKSEPVKHELKLTRKELFERLYDETKCLSKAQRKKAIIAEMRPRFKSYEDTHDYVVRNLERKAETSFADVPVWCEKQTFISMNSTTSSRLHTMTASWTKSRFVKNLLIA